MHVKKLFICVRGTIVDIQVNINDPLLRLMSQRWFSHPLTGENMCWRLACLWQHRLPKPIAQLNHSETRDDTIEVLLLKEQSIRMAMI